MIPIFSPTSSVFVLNDTHIYVLPLIRYVIDFALYHAYNTAINTFVFSSFVQINNNNNLIIYPRDFISNK